MAISRVPRRTAGICLALLGSLLGPATAHAQNGGSYDLSIVTYGLGRVAGDGIDCGAGATTCVATYTEPRSVVLTATPANGHVFLGWVGNCMGIETTTVHVDGPKHCEAFFDRAEPTSPRTLLALDSGPGDYVGRGARYLYSSIDTAWQISADGTRLRFALESVDGSWWYVTFSAARGGSLEPGVYPNAKRWPFNSVSPGLEVYGNERGCQELTGRFIVHEIVVDDYTGALLSFAADFEQHCEHADAALFGAIRYNSLAPGVSAFGGAYPVYTLDIDPPQHGRIVGGSIDCGAGRSACHLTAGSPTTVALDAVPDRGYQLAGWSGGCSGGGAATTVRVQGPATCAATFVARSSGLRTMVVMNSATGDYIGQGKHWVYSSVNVTVGATTIDGLNGVALTIEGTDAVTWQMQFAAPIGRTLAPGVYANVVLPPTRTSTPSMDVAANTRGCGAVFGRFVVREIRFSDDGAVDGAAIDFEQQCQTASAPKLVGSVRYRSTVDTSLLGGEHGPILLGQSARTTNGGWLQRLSARDDGYAAGPSLRLPWPAYNAFSGEVHPAAGDIDGDGRSEIVLGLGSGGAGWIAILDDETTGFALLQWLQVDWPAYNRNNGAVYPAVGDLDGDGEAEIVVGLGTGGHGWLEIFRGASAGFAHDRWIQVGYPSWAAVNGETHPAVGDLDGNGAAEIVVGLGRAGAGWLDVFYDARQGHRHKEWIQVTWPLFNGRSGATWPAIGDTNGDGTPELVVGLGPGGEGWLQVWTPAGGPLRPRDWLRVEWPAYNTRCGETRPAIGPLGLSGPGIVVGLGSCATVAGWMAVIETALPGRPVVWRNTADAAFRVSGGGLYPALLPR